MKDITLRIKRQAGPGGEAYWEEFSVPWQPALNVISVLQWIRANPKNAAGRDVTPPVWDCSCLEEICGACAMIINGRPRMACSALVDKLDPPITLEPLKKFPVVRDLVVNREALFAGLREVKAWSAAGSVEERPGAGPLQKPELQQELYELSRCSTCGICAEVCPTFAKGSPFLGPLAIGQAYACNKRPLGDAMTSEREEIIMGPRGVECCDDDGACTKMCPKEIPLAEVMKNQKRASTWSFF